MLLAAVVEFGKEDIMAAMRAQRVAAGGLTGAGAPRATPRRLAILGAVAVLAAVGVGAGLLASSGSGSGAAPATAASARITTGSLAAVKTAMIAKLHAGRVHFSWVVCVRNGERFRGVAVTRCNVEFGDPHVQAYCSVFRGGRLVTSDEDPAIPCRPDDAGFTTIIQTSHSKAYESPMRQPDFTLTAGPTMASHRVLTALGSPVIYDYDPAFLARFRETEEMLQRAYRTSGDVVLMQGEAVLGLEAAARGLVSPGMRCLNLVSGVYAAWFGDWLREYGADVVELRVPYDEAIDPSAVASALDRRRAIRARRDRPLRDAVGDREPAARDRGAFVHAHRRADARRRRLLAGGLRARGRRLAHRSRRRRPAEVPRRTARDVARLRQRMRAWEAMEANPAAPRGSFLSLLDWKHAWIDGGRVAFPYTPSVSDLNGVHAALAELHEDGLEATIAQHELAARATRAGVLGLGLELWPREETYAAHCVTAVRIPTGATVPALLGHIRERYGVMLSGGHGELKEKLVRLGHMGPAARSLYPLIAVSALGRGLADLDVTVDVGAGAAATMAVLSQQDPR